jgi:WD40 repeat protein
MTTPQPSQQGTGWTEAVLREAMAKMPQAPTSAAVVAGQLAELRERLVAVREFEKFDPRSLTSIVPKCGYREVERIEGHTASVLCLQALPDGRIVSGSMDHTIRIWTRESDGDWSSEVLAGHEIRVSCLQALPDDRIVSGSADSTIRIWTRGNDGGWSSEVLRGNESSVTCLQALPDGRIISGSMDHTIRIWDGTPINEGAS